MLVREGAFGGICHDALHLAHRWAEAVGGGDNPAIICLDFNHVLSSFMRMRQNLPAIAEGVPGSQRF